MSNPVLFEELALSDGRVAMLVTLNAEKTLNSLTLEMVDLLSPKLSAWEQDDRVAMVIFRGAGDRAFCAGGDIQNLYHDMVEHPGGPCPYCETFFEREYRLDHQIHTYSKPTLAWGHGIVMGGGLGIASACSHRVGTEKTRIAMPEITIGLIPDAGATWTFSRMPAHFAHFLAWTGININGADARLVGLVDVLLNHAQQAQLLDRIATATWGEDLHANLSAILEDLAGEANVPESKLAPHAELIERVITECLTEANPAAAFLASKAEWQADEALAKAFATFEKGCPTTAQIIPEQFRRAAELDIQGCFALELNLAVQCARHPDFAEGVRALLIDKDGQPAWRHAEMGAVPGAWIDEHFASPWEVHPLSDL